MIQIRNLQFELHDQLLFQPLNISIDKGSCVQLCGHNGVGKTSLLKILAGLLQPRRASIFLQDKKLRSLKTVAKYLGHDLALKPSLTLEENLAYYAHIMQANTEAIKIACQYFELETLRHIEIQHLSAGQKHRSQLAKLLIGQRMIWLLDEPFTALDQKNIQQLLSLFKTFLAADGIIIFTSHHPIQSDDFSIQQYFLQQALP